MTRSQGKNETSIWRFRREITFGNVLHLAVLAVVAITAWANLHAELVVIQHDLNQLVADNRRLHQHITNVSDQGRDHEYRLVQLETRSEWTEQAGAKTDAMVSAVKTESPCQKGNGMHSFCGREHQ